MALDAKMNFDDNALFRQKWLQWDQDEEERVAVNNGLLCFSGRNIGSWSISIQTAAQVPQCMYRVRVPFARTAPRQRIT